MTSTIVLNMPEGARGGRFVTSREDYEATMERMFAAYERQVARSKRERGLWVWEV